MRPPSQFEFETPGLINHTPGLINHTCLHLLLGFHDCVGGCNGCINFNNPDNAGLQPAVDLLKQVYAANNYTNIGVSLADFFAFAATVGVTMGIQQSNSLRNGGADCTPVSCPGP